MHWLPTFKLVMLVLVALGDTTDHARVVRGRVVVSGEDGLLRRILRILQDLGKVAISRILCLRVVVVLRKKGQLLRSPRYFILRSLLELDG